MPEEFVGHIGDVTVLDKIALAVLCVFLVGIGVYPSLMVPVVEAGVRTVLRLLGGA
jgi:NADH:ubiquinone oxidoreductase subunit 4 (subunit M)